MVERGIITAWLTSCLSGKDSAALLMLNEVEIYKFGQIQTSQRGGQLYCDTSPYKVVFVWCYEFDWLQWVFSDLTIIIFVFQKTSQHFFVSLATSQHLRLCPLHRSEHQTGKNKIACRNLLLPLKQKWNFVNLFSVCNILNSYESGICWGHECTWNITTAFRSPTCILSATVKHKSVTIKSHDVFK